MKLPVGLLAASLALSAHHVAGVVLRARTTANPIRKVVNMLQAMQAKVQAEGEKEKELYEKFMCYCKTGSSDLSKSIHEAKEKLGSLASDIETAEAKHVETKEQLKSAQADRSAAKQALEEATAIREKEAASFAKFKADSDANIAAIAKAVASIEKGVAGGFLQTSAANVVRRLVMNSKDMEDDSRQMLTSFLSGSEEYAPQSGQITGILKQMHDEMVAALNDATEAEQSAIKAFNDLRLSKLEEKKALTQAIETKSERIGELAVSIAEMKNDAGDTADSLDADKKFLAELETGCATKTADWQARSKTRSEELVALADTIKILNDDDALELFKKTLPSPSLLQVRVGVATVRARALTALRLGMKETSAVDHVNLDLIALALHGKKVGFDQVIKMIDEMVATLKQEQVDDNQKKEYCASQLDIADDKKKALQHKIANLETEIAAGEERVATLTDEIAELTKGIATLDKMVAESTANRKSEHEEFNDLIASNSAAKEVLNMAKNRLQAFYNPKLAKPMPSFVQLSHHAVQKESPGPPPETFGAYRTKSEENGGVIAMVNVLIADLDKEITEAKTEEKDAQADYEVMMKDSAAKRVADSKSLSEKKAAKADTEATLESKGDDKASATKELAVNARVIGDLHAECDWLSKYFVARKDARASEIDSLENAKAVLSSADYSR